MRRVNLAVLILAFMMIHIAASDANSNAGASQAGSFPQTAVKKTITAPTPQSFISNTIVNLFRPKTGAELMAERQRAIPTVPKPVAVPSVPKIVTPPKPAPTVVKPGYVPPPPPKTPTPQVNQIRQEIQKILDLNQKLKDIQGNRVAQMQRIQEQARIHQKILDQLEVSKKTQAVSGIPDKEALLAQEKLRIIHEETQRNQALIESVKNAQLQSLAKESATNATAVAQDEAAKQS